MKLLPLHKRKPLTQLEAAKVFRDAKGKCWICGKPILEPNRWRDEHKIPLAKGGTNELSNRAPVHFECAPAKDKTDKASIAKAKRIEAKRIAPNFKPPGFSKAEKQRIRPTIGLKQNRNYAAIQKKMMVNKV
jgi:5-methylcytosine-specific restriction endonuclease McrA